jgi:quercetin dioxygenase-like cupin family protein
MPLDNPPTLTGAVTPAPAPSAPVGATLREPIVVSADRLAWTDAPPMLPPGARVAVIEGDPSSPNALFTLRAKFPPNYRIMPHTHPTDEHATVLSGTFLIGHGSTFAREQMTELPPGGYAAMPVGHAHFAATGNTETIIQIHAVGPLEFIYINPADDPRNQPKR